MDRLSVRGTEEMSLTNVDNEVGEILVSTPMEGRAGQGDLEWENAISAIRAEQSMGRTEERDHMGSEDEELDLREAESRDEGQASIEQVIVTEQVRNQGQTRVHSRQITEQVVLEDPMRRREQEGRVVGRNRSDSQGLEGEQVFSDRYRGEQQRK